MANDEEIVLEPTTKQGVRTRSQSMHQTVPETMTDEHETDDAASVDIPTAFDHIIIDIVGWQKDSDCYQALVQNDYVDIQTILAEYHTGTASTLRFNADEKSRLAPPALLMDNKIACLTEFITKKTDYITSDDPNETLLSITKDEWDSFRKEYIKAKVEASTPIFMAHGSSPSYHTPTKSDAGTSYSSGYSGPAKTDAEKFRELKRDKTDFTVFHRDSDWDTWNQSLDINVRYHKCTEVTNPDYVPQSPAEVDLFKEKQMFMMSIWDKTLKTKKGLQILRRHRNDHDAQAVYSELLDYYTNSTHAKLASRALWNAIVSTQLNPDEVSVPYETSLNILLDQM